jgi:hypothetical protein
MLAKIAALIAHEAHARVVAPVLAEYRKLNTPPACELPHVGDRTYDVASTLAAHIERAGTEDHKAATPLTASTPRPFGFTSGP